MQQVGSTKVLVMESAIEMCQLFFFANYFRLEFM